MNYVELNNGVRMPQMDKNQPIIGNPQNPVLVEMSKDW